MRAAEANRRMAKAQEHTKDTLAIITKNVSEQYAQRIYVHHGHDPSIDV